MWHKTSALKLTSSAGLSATAGRTNDSNNSANTLQIRNIYCSSKNLAEDQTHGPLNRRMITAIGGQHILRLSLGNSS